MTFVENIYNKKNKKRILIGPLDWGLGHATRCMPIIKALQENNIEVFIAAAGPVASLLQQEFPDLKLIHFEGYGVSYSKNKRYFLLKIILQLPKIYKVLRKENRLLKQIVETYNLDAVISDNRLGFRNKKCRSVFITHQLAIQTGNSLLDKWVQKINYYFINKFDECWVPDVNSALNFAGALSHPFKMPNVPVHYIGSISRFSKMETVKKNPLTILISGPEPQRSIFENLVLEQSKHLHFPITIVRGLPDDKTIKSPSSKNITFHNHLKAAALSILLQESEMVIARSGYSTVMDLISIQQKAILIPTPGQTEQEYLAHHLLTNGIFYTVNQHEFNLEKNLKEASGFNYQFVNNHSTPDAFIKEWVKKI